MLVIRYLDDEEWSTIQFSGKNEDKPNFDKIVQDLWKKMEDNGICNYKLNVRIWLDDIFNLVGSFEGPS